jgi:hypothetical protein
MKRQGRAGSWYAQTATDALQRLRLAWSRDDQTSRDGLLALSLHAGTLKRIFPFVLDNRDGSRRKLICIAIQ